MKKSIIFTLLALLFWTDFSYGMGRQDITFRSVTLTVVDAETRRPLEGIVVTVKNSTFYPKQVRFLGLVIEQFDEITSYGYRYVTDANGVVEIPEYVYNVKPNNFLREQHIIINAETRDESFSMDDRAAILSGISVLAYTGDDDRVYRLRQDYKIGYILCKLLPLTGQRGQMEARYAQSDRSKSYYTKVIKEYDIFHLTEEELEQGGPFSFYCGHENITFYLQRFTGS